MTIAVCTVEQQNGSCSNSKDSYQLIPVSLSFMSAVVEIHSDQSAYSSELQCVDMLP